MNWPNIITALESRGLTQTEIARIANCSQGLISDLKRGYRGKRLNYQIGAALIHMRDNPTDGLPPEQCKEAA